MLIHITKSMSAHGQALWPSQTYPGRWEATTAYEEAWLQGTVLKDATYKTLDTSLNVMYARCRKRDRALSFFYYSGHGVANPETQINYLIPHPVDVADSQDEKIWIGRTSFFGASSDPESLMRARTHQLCGLGTT